jgi:hypothetical protein
MPPIEAILFEPACFFDGSEGNVYADVLPALSELKAMGIELFVAQASTFEGSLRDFFSGPWTGANPENTIYITATAEGMKTARSLGVHPVLMMNDPDEAMRLVTQNPAGGIVSLAELPDFIRLVAAENGMCFQ